MECVDVDVLFGLKILTSRKSSNKSCRAWGIKEPWMLREGEKRGKNTFC